jgi:hypothetical protein
MRSGDRPGLQNRRAAGHPVTGGFDPHSLPPFVFKVFADDETRFVSSWIDTSREQSWAILKARAKGPKVIDRRDLPVWQTAMSALKYKKGDFEHPPKWLRYLMSF